MQIMRIGLSSTSIFFDVMNAVVSSKSHQTLKLFVVVVVFFVCHDSLR